MRSYFLQYSFILVCLFFLASSSFAQLTVPAASPLSTVQQRVGLTDFTLTYSRPGLRGREAFGEAGVVPFGERWRTGANAATKLTVSDDVSVAGQVLPKGEYAVLTIPQAETWSLLFFAYESSSWQAYAAMTPMVTVECPAQQQQPAAEALTLDIYPSSLDHATLRISWGKVFVEADLGLPTRDKTLASLAKLDAGPSWFAYFQAATYLHESKQDLPRALAYIERSNDSPDVRFFQKYREALILRDLGRPADAKKAAASSLALAKAADNADFVRLNTTLLRELEP